MSHERTDSFQAKFEPAHLALSASFLLNSVADAAILFAVWPFIVITGPTINDTISGALPYLFAISIAPSAGLLVSRVVRTETALAGLQIVLQLFRLTLAVLLFNSIGSDTAIASDFMFIVTTFWSVRMAEHVLFSQFSLPERGNAGAGKKERLARMFMSLSPAIAFLMMSAKTGQFTPAAFLITTLFLNSLSLLLMGGTCLFAAAATKVLNHKEPSSHHPAPGRRTWPIYELALSVFSSVFLTLPLLLALTDHSQESFVLRNDILLLFAGWIGGTVIAGSIESRKGGLEILHVALTAALAAMLVSTSTTITMALFFTSAFLASSIVVLTDSQMSSKQNRHPLYAMSLRLTLLAVLSSIAYFNLSGSSSVLPQSVILRTLAMMCLIPLSMMILVWRNSRILICRMVAYLIPFEKIEDLRSRATIAATVQNRNGKKRASVLLITRNIDLLTAIVLSYKLGTHTIIVTQDGFLSEPLVTRLLALFDISIVNREGSQGLYASFILKAKLGEELLIHDSSQRIELILEETLHQLGMNESSNRITDDLHLAFIDRVRTDESRTCLAIAEFNKHQKSSDKPDRNREVSASNHPPV